MINLNDLESTIDKEVDIYGFNNSLDDVTIEELRFITSSFCKYYKKMISKKTNFLDILTSFDNTLEIVSMGVIGTSFNTNAPELYKNLPTIKAMTEEIISELQKNIETLETKCNSLSTKNKKLVDELESLKKEVSSLKKSVKTLSYTSPESHGGSFNIIVLK